MIVLIPSAPSPPPLYLLFPPCYSLLTASLSLSLSVTVQLCSPSAYRVGQAVGLQRRLRRGGLLGAPEQRRSAGRGEEEQQEATFFHLPHHVPQAHAGSSPAAPLHGDQRARPHQLQQPHGGRPHRRDHGGTLLQRTFPGEEGEGAREQLRLQLLHCRSRWSNDAMRRASKTTAALHLACHTVFLLTILYSRAATTNLLKQPTTV